LEKKTKKLFSIVLPVTLLSVSSIFFISHALGVTDDPLRFLGFLVCCRLAYGTVKLIWYKVFKQPKVPKFYGNWAIVTGCTSGIGEAFVRAFAEEGLNVFMISRSFEKLTSLSQEVMRTYGVKTFILVHDFSKGCPEQFTDNLIKSINSLPDCSIGILVNNVGISNRNPVFFHVLSATEIREMLNVNLESVINMTSVILPIMLKNQRGAIINVASASGTHPTPLLSLYSATKAFIIQFSNSISYEYEDKGVDILAITPYYFMSSYFKAKEPTLGIPHPSTVVKATLLKLGCQKQTFPYWFHGFQRMIFDFHPDWPKRLLHSMKANKERAKKKA